MRAIALLLFIFTATAAETLKDVAPFQIGVGISDQIPRRPQDWPLLKSQFTIITPENCMKPVAIRPHADAWNFETPDAFVSFAVSNQLKVVGHTLVWAKDDRTPAWINNITTRDQLLDTMKTHINTVVTRYKGKIAMWDVVNEALDDGTNFLRPSTWSKLCDEDFIVKAFQYAHAADPNALLIYNDYNNESGAKFQKTLRLIESLRAKSVPIHAIGLQGHYELDSVPFDAIEKALAEMKRLNIKVVISELDIDVIPRARWWANNGAERTELAKQNPYANGCPPEILQRQAEQYAKLFAIFNKYRDNILRVSFWNLHDGQSWLNYFPWNRVNHPLLFDREGKPKPAYGAVIKELKRN
jgi:endo-1,4-beta-xylanase